MAAAESKEDPLKKLSEEHQAVLDWYANSTERPTLNRREVAPGVAKRCDKLLELAEAEFGKLRKDERHVIWCAAAGVDAELATGAFLHAHQRVVELEGQIAKVGSLAGFTRPEPPGRVRATVLRWLLVNPKSSKLTDPRGVRVVGATVDGRFDLDGCTVEHPVGLWCCSFADGISMVAAQLKLIGLNGSHVRCPAGRRAASDAVDAMGLRVRGGFQAADGFRAAGKVNLLGARVDGSLVCTGARFSNAKRDAFSADRAEIGGGVFFRAGAGGTGFVSEGTVRLAGATIGGNLECIGARFSNAVGDAFSAEQAEIGGSVFFSADAGGTGFMSEGKVRLVGATIGGDLSCLGARFSNAEGDAFNADRAKIGGDVFFTADADGPGFMSEGEVRLVGATIGGDLSCTGARFSKRGGDALHMQSVELTGALMYWGCHADGVVDLTRARVGMLHDHAFAESAWKTTSKLCLTGFRYDAIYAQAPTDATTRLAWLDKHDETMGYGMRPPELDEAASWPRRWWRRLRYLAQLDCKPSENLLSLDPQPYRQLAEVLRKQGHEADARAVMRGLGWRQLVPSAAGWIHTETGWMSRYGRLLLWVLAPLLLTTELGQSAGYWVTAIAAAFWFAFVLSELFTTGRTFLDALTRRTLWSGHLLFGTLYGLVVGHGYSRWLAVFWLAGFIVFGAFMFGHQDGRRMQPTQPYVLRGWNNAIEAGWVPQSEDPSSLAAWWADNKAGFANGDADKQDAFTDQVAWIARYPKFNGYVYAADALVPLVSFHQEEYWTPRSGPIGSGRWWAKSVYLPFHIISGWVIATLFVASFTRLMRSEHQA